MRLDVCTSFPTYTLPADQPAGTRRSNQNGVTQHRRCSDIARREPTMKNSRRACKGSRTGPARQPASPSHSLRRLATSVSFNASLSLQTLILVLCMFSGTAQAVDQENGAVRGRSTLLVDRSGPPRPARYNHIARQNEDPSSSAQSIVAVTSSVVVVPTPAPTATQSSTPQSSTQQPSPAATTLPQVFDSNVGFNFSNTACPNFFTKLQVDPGFQKCYPLSLLLTVSFHLFASLHEANRR